MACDEIQNRTKTMMPFLATSRYWDNTRKNPAKTILESKFVFCSPKKTKMVRRQILEIRKLEQFSTLENFVKYLLQKPRIVSKDSLCFAIKKLKVVQEYLKTYKTKQFEASFEPVT